MKKNCNGFSKHKKINFIFYGKTINYLITVIFVNDPLFVLFIFFGPENIYLILWRGLKGGKSGFHLWRSEQPASIMACHNFLSDSGEKDGIVALARSRNAIRVVMSRKASAASNVRNYSILPIKTDGPPPKAKETIAKRYSSNWRVAYCNARYRGVLM